MLECNKFKQGNELYPLRSFEASFSHSLSRLTFPVYASKEMNDSITLYISTVL